MKKLSKIEWNFIFRRVPRVTVDVIIKDRRGVLLIKRSINPVIGQWHLPGGTLGFKESLLHAVKRKAREETGLQVKVKKFLGIIEFARWREPGYRHIIDLVYMAEPVRGRLNGNAELAGKTLRFFKTVPKNTLIEQKKFMLRNRLMK